MHTSDPLQTCTFVTERLKVINVQTVLTQPHSITELAITVQELLTPNVTHTLPDNFQTVKNVDSARQWIDEMMANSHFLLIQNTANKETIGFCFLYESEPSTAKAELHLGYLLGESHWGKGYASEFMAGLINWCQLSKRVARIIAGVDEGNIPSIRLLEKHGYQRMPSESPQETNLFYEYTV